MSQRSPQQRLLESITERQWHGRVVGEAQLRGWWVFHDYDSRMNRAGMPDLLLVRPPRVLFVELKTETGVMKPVQTEVAAMLAGCPGVEYHLWRPHDEKEMQKCLR